MVGSTGNKAYSALIELNCGTFPHGRFWWGGEVFLAVVVILPLLLLRLVFVLLLLVTWGKQSQIIFLGPRLEFDK